MHRLEEYHQRWTKRLLDERNSEGGWSGELSSSAVATATAVVALHCYDAQGNEALTRAGRHWLAATQLADGGWGDSPESPSNTTATLLARAALHGDKESDENCRRADAFLEREFGGTDADQLCTGILRKYGADRTFSVPILALCASVGLLGEGTRAWQGIPRLPFELAVMPGGMLRLLKLQVVSYAIPALICVGIAQHRNSKPSLVRWLRERFVPRCLRILQQKQPDSGGFLEAAPLTAFCLICLSKAGLKQHPVAAACAEFLCQTVRADASWPIDTNLDQWLTSLAGKAVVESLTAAEKASLSELILGRQFREVHPFTGARPGGWGWTPLSGAVPEADDTPAALILLYHLRKGECSPDIERGCRWLLDIQNADGGMPTFCRGWGRLPFDQSCPDLSSHAWRALSLWLPQLPATLQKRVRRSLANILDFLEKKQRDDGSFLALWFGDQYAADQLAPVYGTAVVLENLQGVKEPWLQKARDFLLAQQLPSGAWGDAATRRPNVIFTARALAALAPCPEAKETLQRGFDFLRPYLEDEKELPVEPIGLYFSQLWYSEKLYPKIFIVQALCKRVQGAGCRVQGAGCRVQGAECRVQSAGCRFK